VKLITVITILVATLTTQAQGLSYKCQGMGADKGTVVTLDVVSSTEVKVDDDYARLDENFSPRSNSDLVRFEYKESSEGTTEVLVQEQLLDGATKGLIKIQNRGEGFSTSSFYCTQK